MKNLAKTAARRGRWSAKMQRKYENIDKKATEIMLQAETNCVPKFRYQTSWSLPLMRASKTIRYWNLRLSTINGRKISPAVLATARTEAEIRDYTTTKDQVITERKLARIRLKDLIKMAEDLRET